MRLTAHNAIPAGQRMAPRCNRFIGELKRLAEAAGGVSRVKNHVQVELSDKLVQAGIDVPVDGLYFLAHHSFSNRINGVVYRRPEQSSVTVEQHPRLAGELYVPVSHHDGESVRAGRVVDYLL